VKALAIVVALAASAHANTWLRASDRAAEAKQDAYDAAMTAGDEAAAAGRIRGASVDAIGKYIAIAEKAYREAASARPDAGEPWYRLGELVDTYFFDCQGFNPLLDIWRSPLCGGFDAARAEEVVAAWNEFEKRSPLDPRLSVTFGSSHVLFERAILNTKLVDGRDPKKDRVHLEAAARDYEAVLDRTSVNEETDETIVSNLAETYMMLGRLDDAIDKYTQALKHGASSGTLFGLAVALDRDGRGEEAIDEIVELGPGIVRDFEDSVMRGNTFFVPSGERFYYFALIAEAFNQTDEAIEYWRSFINSGAHAEFQPRAQQHLDALLKKGAKHTRPRLLLDDELLIP
jgi:tetratricopeptide (TPR) repeat protein